MAAELEAAVNKLEGDAKVNGELYVKLALKAADKVGAGGAGRGAARGLWRAKQWRGCPRRARDAAGGALPSPRARRARCRPTPPPSPRLAPARAHQGVEFFKAEAARLERMISSGGVAAAKLDEMSRKASVLGAFNGDAAGGEAAEAEE